MSDDVYNDAAAYTEVIYSTANLYSSAGYTPTFSIRQTSVRAPGKSAEGHVTGRMPIQIPEETVAVLRHNLLQPVQGRINRQVPEND